MLKLINVTAFMVSFALGVFLVYTLEPTKQHVWIYASPKNASEIQFKAPLQEAFASGSFQSGNWIRPLPT